MQRLSVLLSFSLLACQGSVDALEREKEAQKNNNKVNTGTQSSDPSVDGPTAPTAFVPTEYKPAGAIAGNNYVDFTIMRGVTPPGFFESPWPSVNFQQEDGSIAFDRFPEANALLVSTYVAQAKRDIKGFSVAQTAYFHFQQTPDTLKLPTSGDSMRKESTIFLVDVDEASPDRGTFFPLEFRYYDQKQKYLEAHTLAVKPLAGFVMRSNTQYAYVVRRDFSDKNGNLLGTTADLEATKWTEPRSTDDEERARAKHAPTFNYLESIGVKRDAIAAIALFRTMNTYEVTDKMINVATSLTGNRTPRIVDAKWGSNGSNWARIEGHYCTPNFQQKIETAPFTLSNSGGNVAFDVYGTPLVSDIPANYRNDSDPATKDSECTPLMKASFVLTYPLTGTMPANGWPLLVTAHGTGGQADSFVGNNDFSSWAASQGMAAVGTDQPLHGVSGDPGRRPGAGITPKVDPFPGVEIPLEFGPGKGVTAEEMFYNPVNPAAGRDNARQSTIDTVVLARLIASTNFETLAFNGTPVLPPKAGTTRPRFEASKLFLAGHSQGSQTVAPQAALDPMIKGVLLSGCGGDIRYGILRRKEPFELRSALEKYLGMSGGELDEFHPLMSLAQSFADPVDPQSYARLYRDPLAGRSKQNVLHYVGTTDLNNPRESGIALAVALHATQLEPIVSPILELSFLNIPSSLGPIKANNGDNATIGFIEIPGTANGHFVLYQIPEAGQLAVKYLGSLVGGGAATIGPY